jgi:hypothetical protein
VQIGNNEAGSATALAWIVEHAPGARVIVGLEGTAPTASAWPAPGTRQG